MKTGKEYLEMFAPDIQDNILNNMKNNYGSETYDLILPMLMKRVFESEKYFLSHCFVWSHSPEGLEYWRTIKS